MNGFRLGSIPLHPATLSFTKVLGGSVDRPLTIMTERIYDAEDFYLLPNRVLEAVCNSSYDIVRVDEYETHYSFRTASGWIADVFQK